MPLGTEGKKRASAGLIVGDIFLALGRATNPNSRTDEMSGTGYARKSATFALGSSPNFGIALSAPVSWTLGSDWVAIRSAFGTRVQSQESSDATLVANQLMTADLASAVDLDNGDTFNINSWTLTPQ